MITPAARARQILRRIGSIGGVRSLPYLKAMGRLDILSPDCIKGSFGMGQIFCILAIAGVAIMSVSAKAETWRSDVRGWYIGIDTSIGGGCYMLASYDGGTLIRAHFNPQNDTFGFVVADPAWRSIEPGKFYPMTVRFGNRAPWSGEGVGRRFSGELPAIVMELSVADGNRVDKFIDEFMRMTSVSISYDQNEIARMSLSGTFAGMLAVFECQSQQIYEQGEELDPFRSGKNRETDPFVPR